MARARWLLALAALACAPDRPVREPGPELSTGRGHWPADSVVPANAQSSPGSTSAVPLSVERGKATYYSDRLAGRPTASGEPYRPTALTAAHRKLPFGSKVRVIREDTGRHVIVVINDRGPFAGGGRIIDLSRAAAEQLDMMRAGVVTVRVEVLELGAARKR
ncbi:MAG: septal ring lytic transglycosylase RlpA family protein [Polyangiaceae bacterium]